VEHYLGTTTMRTIVPDGIDVAEDEQYIDEPVMTSTEAKRYDEA
jgi:hypothetical protein